MNSIKSCGLICIKDKLNIEYVVSKIEYILNEDGKYKYIFSPYYDVIDLLDSSIFQGIPGLELDLKKTTYERNNLTPTFISERVPSINREDYNDLLESVNMDYMDPIQYLIRSKNKYSGDNLYLMEYKERSIFMLEENIYKSNEFGIIKIVLDNIAKGNDVLLNDKTILNRKELFKFLLFLYKKNLNVISSKQKEGIKIAKEKNVYKGRKPKAVDELVFLEQYNKVKHGEKTPKEAAKILGISIDKYYRIKNKLQN